MSFADVAGLVGVGVILIAYAGSALGRLSATSLIAHALNLVGAALILVSLAYDFNLPPVGMEPAWPLVALFGLVRGVLVRRV